MNTMVRRRFQQSYRLQALTHRWVSQKLYGGRAKEMPMTHPHYRLMYKAVRRLKQTKDIAHKKSLEKGSFLAELNELVSPVS